MKMTTGKRLRQIMSDKGLKQIDILRMCQPYCEKYGIKLAKNDLSQYINDKVQPGQDKLSILGMALDVSEVWLMGYDVPAEPAASASPSDLRRDEAELLDLYRRVNSLGRKEIRRYAEYICSREEYKKGSSEESSDAC